MFNLTQQAQYVLAGMLSLMPPGKSVYSRTALVVCDEECQQTRMCKEPSVLCDPPKLDMYIFNTKIDINLKSKMSEIEWNKYEESTRLSSFSRTENYEEGLLRYAIIATAIAEVSHELTFANNSDSCKKVCDKNNPLLSSTDQCKKCYSDKPWLGSSTELQAALTTIMFRESGFRQDVHSGTGPLGRGDCEWADKNTQKKVKAFSKNAAPIPGTCKSVCLAQINIGNGIKYGYRAEDLMGTDLASTKKCAEVSARMLSSFRTQCFSRQYQGDKVAGMFAAYGTGGSCKAYEGTGASLREAGWPHLRAKDYRELLKNRKLLSPEVASVFKDSQSQKENQPPNKR